MKPYKLLPQNNPIVNKCLNKRITHIPPCFKNDNPENILDFIEKNSFGIFISKSESKFLATHIPIELDKNENGKSILVGHISKGNPQWKNFINDNEVLATFNSPEIYISSAWCDHENFPTWNYIAIHIFRKLKIIEGEKLIEALTKLPDK